MGRKKVWVGMRYEKEEGVVGMRNEEEEGVNVE